MLFGFLFISIMVLTILWMVLVNSMKVFFPLHDFFLCKDGHKWITVEKLIGLKFTERQLQWIQREMKEPVPQFFMSNMICCKCRYVPGMDVLVHPRSLPHLVAHILEESNKDVTT